MTKKPKIGEKDKKLMEDVDEIFREHPDDYLDRLQDLGFEFIEDEDEIELLEEELARPENARQERLVAFFEGKEKVTEDIFRLFSEEKASEEANYPLIRKYFRQGNPRLKELIVYGLEKYPGRIDLLDDLMFFHEFSEVYPLVVKCYTMACLEQENMETFSKLVQDFFEATRPHDHREYYALRDLFDPDSVKRKIMDFFVVHQAGGQVH